jgi:hypothetical protein
MKTTTADQKHRAIVQNRFVDGVGFPVVVIRVADWARECAILVLHYLIAGLIFVPAVGFDK